MVRARTKSPQLDPTRSLTHNVTSYLACGPLKLPEVMSALLGRDAVPEVELIYSRGYELVTVDPVGSTEPKRRFPIFLPNPAEFKSISFSLYNDLSERELRIIARYNGVGTISEASLESSQFGNHSVKHLLHRLRGGAESTQYYFPGEDQVIDELELEHIPANDYLREALKFKKRLDRQDFAKEGTLPSRSRR